jgi:hypothetical protein
VWRRAIIQRIGTGKETTGGRAGPPLLEYPGPAVV